MRKRFTKKLSINADDVNNFGAVLVCAVRYSLGRRTYMPSLVTRFIMENCKDILSAKTLFVLIRDIEECKYYGDDCDKETWMRFLNWLKEEQEKVKTKE